MTTLQWTCAGCHEPIDATAPGYVTIRVADAVAVQRARAELAAAHTTEAGLVLYEVAALDSLPSAAAWGAFHEKCAPEDTPTEYWFSLDRCRTTDDLLMWTLHLMEKGWLVATNWSEFANHVAIASGVRDT